MKYYIVVGEASGDLHASNLMQGIMEVDANAQFRFFGGDLMAAKGGELVKHYRDMAFMGFLEVAMNLRTILRNIKLCRKDILGFKPDALILVDYPGFNMRIARFAKRAGIKVFYYIAPKVWAWNEGRVRSIRAYIDHLFVILPFEVDFFRKHGIDPIYEGNPTLDAIRQGHSQHESFTQFAAKNGLPHYPIIALMPGSRRQEIKYNLPTMLSLVKHFPSYQFVIAGAPSLGQEVYQPFIRNLNIKVVHGQTYSLLHHSTIAIVTSGTATLEAALIGVPEVVCYRSSVVSMLIAWAVIRVKFISLVNLILSREAVTELVQYSLTPTRLLQETRKILPEGQYRQTMLQDFVRLREMMGAPGASLRVGKRMFQLLSNSIA